MFFSKTEKSHFERNLKNNLYTSAYDVLRKRYVFIFKTIRENDTFFVIAKTPGDKIFFKYHCNELINYGF